MSYIIKETNPFIRVKLTEIGRQKLATGQLTFTQFAVGDSEIDYGYVLPNPPGVDEQILRPKDQQPNIKTYLKKADGSIKSPLSAADIKILGITVNNPADERGFFNPAGTPGAGWGIQTSATYVKASGTIPCTSFIGTDSIDLGVTNFTDCDFVLFIFSNDTSGPVTTTAQIPVPYLWYKIKNKAGSTATLDRPLPDMGYNNICTGGNIQFYIYPGCEDPINTYYGSGCTSAYWNTGTLTFDSCCDISVTDVPVWNQNNVWCEDMIGTQSTTATHREYGSIDYIGEKQYLGYPCDCGGIVTSIADICAPGGPGGPTQQDALQKGIGIIHYTNNTISNFYGEFFYIDATQNKLLILDVPTVMWHRRTGGGTSLGMRFISSGTLKNLPNTDIQYYDLLEDAAYVSSPIIVGRVYPQLKVIAISDEELLATMSFKSSRNWSLPMLKATLIAPAVAPGLLAPGETLYLTYTIRPTNGLKPSLPCQKYTVITNNGSTPQDVGFTIEATGLLSYMRKIELGWDGLGFYGHEFVLLSQIVPANGNCRPDPALWKESIWEAAVPGETLDPAVIEDQNFMANNFILDSTRYSSGAIYNIETDLNVPIVGDTATLNFGDERFFYGNLETYIGAKIFKTVFSLNVDRSQFTTTTNPTYTSSNGGTFNISEVGIYDNVGNLVMIGKFSSPIPLGGGAIANIEMTLDF